MWDAGTGVLRWLDVLGRRVHTFDPATGQNTTVETDVPVGSLTERASGGLLAATPRGFESLDPDTGALEVVVAVESHIAGNRMNDGKCDPVGRFWAGTMGDGAHPTGTLYCLDRDHSVRAEVRGATVSNGLGWSPDGRTMYWIDTPTYGVDAFDYDVDTGRIDGRRRLIEVPVEWGSADGMCVDENGDLWVATWGSGAIRHHAPNGSLRASLEVPVSQPSSCCFGGPELRDLYITTATYDMSEEQLAAEPTAGGLYRCRPGVAGLPVPPFAA